MLKNMRLIQAFRGQILSRQTLQVYFTFIPCKYQFYCGLATPQIEALGLWVLVNYYFSGYFLYNSDRIHRSPCQLSIRSSNFIFGWAFTIAKSLPITKVAPWLQDRTRTMVEEKRVRWKLLILFRILFLFILSKYNNRIITQHHYTKCRNFWHPSTRGYSCWQL